MCLGVRINRSKEKSPPITCRIDNLASTGKHMALIGCVFNNLANTYGEAHGRFSQEVRTADDSMKEEHRTVMVHHRKVALHQHDRAHRLSEPQQRAEAEGQVMAELAKESIASFERWRSRRMARQAILSLFQPEWTENEGGTPA